ncbi:MAG: superoxide dismutase family protein [Candidatus Omnitrophica bacterium]|nr:superoxide dismutase family protein [Candidatus Omnitrophota bacterium]
MRKIRAKSILFGLVWGSAFLLIAGSGAEVRVATAELSTREGRPAGRVVFTQQDEGVKVSVRITDLAPGEHALHIHEKGKCLAPDFTSAGGHFNPGNAKHGFLNRQGPHAGDLPNIRVKPDGTLTTSFRTQRITLKEEASHSLFIDGGTSVVIHRDPDDYVTDPAGKGGPRIACGIVKKGRPAGEKNNSLY